MMEVMVVSKLFSGYRVGVIKPTVVSHLQFVDDTLILGEKSYANVQTMRVVLLLFEALSDLKVIFYKSQLIGVNINDSWLIEASMVMSCRVGRLPFCICGCL